jgi:hypothetical protein
LLPPPPRSPARPSIAGFSTAFFNPQRYVDAQVPSAATPPPLSPSQTVVTLQTGNMFLLLMGLAVLVCFCSNARVVRSYLVIVACADVGHIYSVYVGMGPAMFFDVAGWNDMGWGAIGGSAFLCVNRIATVAGVFGKLGEGVMAKRR